MEQSRRRIDLLALNKEGSLVIIELKRTEDGGHMDLQAIRYAAMISTLTFDRLVAIYQGYLADNDREEDALDSLLKFLEWSEPDEQQFGQEVKIVLASADFSKELTSSVMWLNDYGLDIRCVRMQPYLDNGRTLLDVQTVIPLPEVADFQVRIREKKYKERQARESARDFTKYDVGISGRDYTAQNKRWTMFRLISAILASGGTPTQVMDALSYRRNRLFRVLEGHLTAGEAVERIMADDPGGAVPLAKRYFCDEDDQVFQLDNKTYVLTNQWGRDAHTAALSLAKAFPRLEIEIAPSDA